MPDTFSQDPATYEDRTILVKKLKMLPYEFIVRGFMFGSMWEEYKENGTYCGSPIEEPADGPYKLAQKLVTPMVTPSVKNNEGHDENITMDRLRSELGEEKANEIADICVQIYNKCYEKALKNGVMIADTKFEFGYDENGVLTIGDEVLTPDSSRFWAADEYETGVSPKSFDKQFVRDWLIQNNLKGVTPSPALPEDIVTTTSNLYKECYERVVG